MFEQTHMGFMERMKLMNAMRLLGSGMSLGSLDPYAHEVAFSLLLQVFRRQISDDRGRSRKDLIEITYRIIEEMELPLENEDQVKRLVNGILWADTNSQSPFEGMVYNEKTKQHEGDRFRYLTEDTTFSSWEKEKKMIYRLTDRAEQMIFVTREIMEELGFDLEQFYTLQLIKNGYYKEAIGSTQNLIARVKNFIRKEEEYKRDILRNPRLILLEQRAQRRKKKQEIQKQFEDEQKMFETMIQWKKHDIPFNKEENIFQLFEDIELARQLHDLLAKKVLDNIAYELELRLKYPQSFWQLSTISFKKNYWDEEIVKKGVPTFDLLEEVVAGLFSPEIPFIYPLDWAWQEQIANYQERKEEQKEEQEQKEIPVKEIPWEQILALWKPIFDILLTKKEFSPVALQELLQKEEWNDSLLFIDIFMMFTLGDTKLYTVEEITNQTDIRIALFTQLCIGDEKYKELEGTKIKPVLYPNESMITGKRIKISPYGLSVVDERKKVE